MTVTATTSTWHPPHGRSHSQSSRPSSTPRGLPPMMNNQPTPHQRSPQPRSPPSKSIRSPSPNYFGFIVNDDSIPPDSNPGQHAKQNWNYSASPRASNNNAFQHQSNENNPAYDAFRKQSESYGFSLSRNFSGLHASSAQQLPSSSNRQAEDTPSSPKSRTTNLPHKTLAGARGDHKSSVPGSFFNLPRQDSPATFSSSHRSVADHQSARLSLPASELQAPLAALNKTQRSETLPAEKEQSGPSMVSPQDIAKLLQTYAEDVLLLDLRVYAQYASSRVRGALNLCIPTTLLKRPAFTVQKLAETFTATQDRETFARWKNCSHIVVYDASSMQSKEALMPINVLNKFTSSGWSGQGLVVRGGFSSFAKMCPKLVDSGSLSQEQGMGAPSPSASPSSQNLLPVAGGCSMPTTESAANPFFGNIRQNMDLMDGVGQIPIQRPAHMSTQDEKSLPAWLQDASTPSDAGKNVSDKFLKLERSEQKRMQKALSGQVSYGTPANEDFDRIKIAGIEKGSKNRYNNIFPFDHSRVKLQNIPREGCDYVNANFVQAAYSNRRYIATQAPIPGTFDDFWRVVWEQDVRVIVMLTAESEGGQVKSHAYWNSGDYGPLKVKKLSERTSLLEKGKKTEAVTSPKRPMLPPRSSTQPYTLGEKKLADGPKAPSSSEAPQVIVRHFTLTHSSHPFKPFREVTQLQYTQWPDFGAPASPMALLGLIDQVNRYVRTSSGTGPDSDSQREQSIQRQQQPPILVHCSAGCGRTGTFCTVDSVIDMLREQRSNRQVRGEHDMDVDTPDDWLARDDIDLVAKTVDDFRHQRLSMVQNLRQFVLCYESILQWAVSQSHEDTKPRIEARGKSFQGSMR